jgi:hypothetical protein
MMYENIYGFMAFNKCNITIKNENLLLVTHKKISSLILLCIVYITYEKILIANSLMKSRD